VREIVINTDFGGFGLSDEAVRKYFEYKGWNLVEKESRYDVSFFYRDNTDDDNYFDEHKIKRDDEDLVRVVKELGEKANSKYASLKIVRIPEDVEWEIVEYDGREHIAEKHRTWY